MCLPKVLVARKRQKRNNANSLCRISPKRYNFAEIIERYMANDSKVVPVPVLRRMPAYLSFVKTLQKQGENGGYVKPGVEYVVRVSDPSHDGALN